MFVWRNSTTEHQQKEQKAVQLQLTFGFWTSEDVQWGFGHMLSSNTPSGGGGTPRMALNNSPPVNLLLLIFFSLVPYTHGKRTEFSQIYELRKSRKQQEKYSVMKTKLCFACWNGVRKGYTGKNSTAYFMILQTFLFPSLHNFMDDSYFIF